MKKLLLLILLIAYTIGTIQANGCDPNLVKKQVPGDCSSFYKCFNDNLVVLKCPSGFLYDSEKQMCVGSRKAKCLEPALRRRKIESKL